jgi:hypothetical protein
MVHSAKLPNIIGWACCHMLRRSFDFAHCLSFGSKSRPFLCAGPFVLDQTIARYQQAWDVNAKLYLRHPSHIQVNTDHDSVMPVINGIFPLSEWDHLKHNISKTQCNFDEAFIKVICTSFFLCSSVPPVSCAAPPKPPSEKRLEGKSENQVSLIMSNTTKSSMHTTSSHQSGRRDAIKQLSVFIQCVRNWASV